jgi:hypothetical protein
MNPYPPDEKYEPSVATGNVSTPTQTPRTDADTIRKAGELVTDSGAALSAPIIPAYTMHPKMQRRLRSYRIRSAARRWLGRWVRLFWARELKEQHGYVETLCQCWAEDHTHLQDLCLKAGYSPEEVYGDSYGVPGISDLAAMLYEKTKSNTALKDRIDTLEHQLAEEAGPHYTLDTVNALVKERDELKAELFTEKESRRTFAGKFFDEMKTTDGLRDALNKQDAELHELRAEIVSQAHGYAATKT